MSFSHGQFVGGIIPQPGFVYHIQHSDSIRYDFRGRDLILIDPIEAGEATVKASVPGVGMNRADIYQLPVSYFGRNSETLKFVSEGSGFHSILLVERAVRFEDFSNEETWDLDYVTGRMQHGSSIV